MQPEPELLAQDATREREDREMYAQQNADTEWIDDPRPSEEDQQEASLGRVVLPAAAVGAVVSGLTAPLIVTSVFAGMGFGAEGIVAGSVAAGWQP